LTFEYVVETRAISRDFPKFPILRDCIRAVRVKSRWGTGCRVLRYARRDAVWNANGIPRLRFARCRVLRYAAGVAQEGAAF
jgi:hypothetical protein